MKFFLNRQFETDADLDVLAEIIAVIEGCSIVQAQTQVHSLRVEMGDSLERSVLFIQAELDSTVLGAVLLRPTPKGVLELFGGVPAHPNHAEICETLLRGAQALAGGRGLFTFAAPTYWDVATLERSGFETVAHYQRLTCHSVSLEPVELPQGFTLVNFGQNPDFSDLVAGLRCFEDMWGHHLVNAELLERDLQNYAPEDIWILRDSQATVAGLCRAVVADGEAWIDAPAVRTDLRGRGLHRALLAQTLNAFHSRVVNSFTLESWGEDPHCSADYLEFGFERVESVGIVVWQNT